MESRKSAGHLAALVWACYSILTRKISSFGYPVILTTRRTFFYGILFMVPVITVVTSVLVLKEPVTWISAVGTVMAVAGLFLSEYSGKGRGRQKKKILRRIENEFTK